MNARDLVVILRGLLGGLPGVTTMGFQTFNSWLVVVITASSDEALLALGEKLELRIEVRTAKNRWWRSAVATSAQDRYRVAVSGPRHTGPPPGDDGGGAAS